MVDILGYLDDERAIDPLFSIALDPDELKEIRVCAIRSVGRIRHQRAEQELRNALDVVSEQYLREEIAEALLEWKKDNKTIR